MSNFRKMIMGAGGAGGGACGGGNTAKTVLLLHSDGTHMSRNMANTGASVDAASTVEQNKGYNVTDEYVFEPSSFWFNGGQSNTISNGGVGWLNSNATYLVIDFWLKIPAGTGNMAVMACVVVNDTYKNGFDIYLGNNGTQINLINYGICY